MDMFCKYINKKEGYCKSPLVKEKRHEMICYVSNYKLCPSFPADELKEIIKSEKGSDLEKRAKE